MIGPQFHWVGSSDEEVKSGRATFCYPEDNQEFSIDLPDFTTAFTLDQFIRSVYNGGKIEGAKSVQFAVENAIKNIVG